MGRADARSDDGIAFCDAIASALFLLMRGRRGFLKALFTGIGAQGLFDYAVDLLLLFYRPGP